MTIKFKVIGYGATKIAPVYPYLKLLHDRGVSFFIVGKMTSFIADYHELDRMIREALELTGDQFEISEKLIGKEFELSGVWIAERQDCYQGRLYMNYMIRLGNPPEPITEDNFPLDLIFC